LIALLAGICNCSYAQGGGPMLKSYLDAMRSLSHNCSMAYTATCIYPDQRRTTVAGKLAISDRNYYDSSNVRFVLMNSKWLVVAEHESRMINVVYLPDWKKKMGKEFELDISGYLLSNASLEDFSGFKVIPVGKDSFAVSVTYDLGEGQAIDLKLHYPKDGTMPARYEGIISYAMSDEDPGAGERPETVKVQFECHSISRSVDVGVFDDGRLIDMAGGKARMKRYNNYKISRKSS